MSNYTEDDLIDSIEEYAEDLADEILHFTRKFADNPRPNSLFKDNQVEFLALVAMAAKMVGEATREAALIYIQTVGVEKLKQVIRDKDNDEEEEDKKGLN